MCNDEHPQAKGPDPYVMAAHRREHWPQSAVLPDELAVIYEKVKHSGLPNALGVRVEVPSKLNLQEWDNL